MSWDLFERGTENIENVDLCMPVISLSSHWNGENELQKNSLHFYVEHTHKKTLSFHFKSFFLLIIVSVFKWFFSTNETLKWVHTRREKISSSEENLFCYWLSRSIIHFSFLFFLCTILFSYRYFFLLPQFYANHRMKSILSLKSIKNYQHKIKKIKFTEEKRKSNKIEERKMSRNSYLE